MLLFLMLTSCSNDHTNIEIVKQFINSPNDQKESFLDENFQLNMIGENEFIKGKNSISILTGSYETKDLTQTVYKDLRIESTSKNEVKVTYQLRSWLIDCIHLGSSFEDIYLLKNGKINYLTTKVTSVDSDSMRTSEQSNFRDWIDEHNLRDSINETQSWLKYLKIYCNSERVIE